MSPDQVSNLICCLTNDEDERQDLWVHHLNGNPPSTFASHLEKLKLEHSIERDFCRELFFAMNHLPTEKFFVLLSKLSEYEQSIACLLALGLTVSELSGYKGISEIRIRQVISVMKEHDCWEELYAKEKIDRRRASRAE